MWNYVIGGIWIVACFITLIEGTRLCYNWWSSLILVFIIATSVLQLRACLLVGTITASMVDKDIKDSFGFVTKWTPSKLIQCLNVTLSQNAPTTTSFARAQFFRATSQYWSRFPFILCFATAGSSAIFRHLGLQSSINQNESELNNTIEMYVKTLYNVVTNEIDDVKVNDYQFSLDYIRLELKTYIIKFKTLYRSQLWCLLTLCITVLLYLCQALADNLSVIGKAVPIFLTGKCSLQFLQLQQIITGFTVLYLLIVIIWYLITLYMANITTPYTLNSKSYFTLDTSCFNSSSSSQVPSFQKPSKRVFILNCSSCTKHTRSITTPHNPVSVAIPFTNDLVVKISIHPSPLISSQSSYYINPSLLPPPLDLSDETMLPNPYSNHFQQNIYPNVPFTQTFISLEHQRQPRYQQEENKSPQLNEPCEQFT